MRRKYEPQSVFESSTLFSFINNTKRIKLVDLATKDIRDISLADKLPEPINKNISICELPGGKYFCFGNLHNGNYSSLAFIIDKNHNVSLLSTGIPCSESSCCYAMGFVWIFGGEKDGKDLNIAYKYSLKDDI